MSLPDALRAKHRGRWLAWSRPALEHDVEALSQGLRRHGLAPGGTLSFIGSLGLPFVLALLASHRLGARLRTVAPEHADTAPLNHVIVDRADQLERLLAWRPQHLGRVWLASPVLGRAGDEAGNGVGSLAELLAEAPAAIALPATRPDVAGLRVLAEFDPSWAPGVSWLLHHWLQEGATLVLPEAGGEGWRDRQDAKPHRWLVDPATLDVAAESLHGRLPRRLGPLAAWRARRVLGLRRDLHIQCEGLPGTEAMAIFARLGLQADAAASSPQTWSPVVAEGLA
ncbi:MAG TPA: hypothetical protein VLC92_01040 [Rhodocyclaceae bacterium]|nr:hypothetical protein [Rhodocyclaceae bacterium]